ENAEKDDGEESGAAKEITEPNPLYEKLVAQLESLKGEIGYRERDKSFIDTEIVKYSGRVEQTPQVEQDVTDVLRDHDDLKKRYHNLNAKLSEARLSESLESKQKGSQFTIVDPANYPIVPAKPNKQAALLGGAVMSLGLSLVLAIVVDVGRQKVWSQL